MKLNLKKSSAFTLVELLLVVGIIAFGSVVAYITLPKVQSTARANAEATSINTLSAGVKNVYAGSNVFNNLSPEVLIKAKAAPDKMIDTAGAGNTLVNSFGGAVDVAPASIGGSAQSNAYTITYDAIPDAECNKLATGVGNNFVSLSINGTAIKTYPSTDPIAPNLVSDACAAAATPGSNQIVFTGN